MEIKFKTGKIEKLASSKKKLFKKFGDKELVEDILSRLRNIEIFENLLEIKTMPSSSLHKLKGDRKGQLAIDISGRKKPRRIVFECNNGKDILKNWYDDRKFESVTSITIVDIGDPYHE